MLLLYPPQVSAFIADDISWMRGNDVLRRAFNRDVVLSSECDTFVQSCLPAPLAAFLAVRLASEGNLDLANGVVDLLRKCEPDANDLAGWQSHWECSFFSVENLVVMVWKMEIGVA